MTPRIAIALCLIFVPERRKPGLRTVRARQRSCRRKLRCDKCDSGFGRGGDDPDEPTDQTESDDQDTAPIDVHRHRPGACPEGPPCKGGD